MEGFKTLPKGVQCFKEGGSVKYKSRHSEKSEMSEDIAQDKKVVKKAINMHDDQLHEGKKTNLKRLKKGGNVKRFDKASGEYGAKKTDADIKRIEGAKNFKPKKMANGGMSGPAMAGPAANAPSGAMGNVDAKLAMLEKQRQMEKMKRAGQLDPAQQGELISQDPRAAGLSAAPVMRKKGGKACK